MNMKADILSRKEQVNTKETTINSISFSNKWSNKKNQLGDRNIPTTLYELSIGQLDRLAGCCGIPVQ